MYVFTMVLNDHYCEIIIYPVHDIAIYRLKYAANCMFYRKRLSTRAPLGDKSSLDLMDVWVMCASNLYDAKLWMWYFIFRHVSVSFCCNNPHSKFPPLHLLWKGSPTLQLHFARFWIPFVFGFVYYSYYLFQFPSFLQLCALRILLITYSGIFIVVYTHFLNDYPP